MINRHMLQIEKCTNSRDLIQQLLAWLVDVAFV